MLRPRRVMAKHANNGAGAPAQDSQRAWRNPLASKYVAIKFNLYLIGGK